MITGRDEELDVVVSTGGGGWCGRLHQRPVFCTRLAGGVWCSVFGDWCSVWRAADGSPRVRVYAAVVQTSAASLLRTRVLPYPARAPVKAIEQTGESPVQSCRYRSVAEGNCVFNRKGGKQLEANEQSVTQVNAIRPSLSGSVRAKREPLTSHHDPDAARLRVAD